jgi:hypothetical protein
MGVLNRMSKTVKKFAAATKNRHQFDMKVVTSDVCEVCKKQCSRGIRYMRHMSEPGAAGNGVPCILTKGQ